MPIVMTALLAMGTKLYIAMNTSQQGLKPKRFRDVFIGTQTKAVITFLDTVKSGNNNDGSFKRMGTKLS